MLHPASYSRDFKGGGASPLEIKLPKREAGYWPLSSAQIKNGAAIPPLLHTSPMSVFNW
jgi:hypothetical protein